MVLLNGIQQIGIDVVIVIVVVFLVVRKDDDRRPAPVKIMAPSTKQRIDAVDTKPGPKGANQNRNRGTQTKE